MPLLFAQPVTVVEERFLDSQYHDCVNTVMMVLWCRLVLLIVETLTLMLRESEIFVGRTACLKAEDGAVVRRLITLLVRRPINVDHLAHSQQVRVPRDRPHTTDLQKSPRIWKFQRVQLYNINIVYGFKCSQKCSASIEKNTERKPFVQSC